MFFDTKADLSRLSIATKNDLKSMCNFDVSDRTTASIGIYIIIVYLYSNNANCVFIQWGFHVGLLYTAGLLYFHFKQPILSWHSAKYNIIFDQDIIYKYKRSRTKNIFSFHYYFLQS